MKTVTGLSPKWDYRIWLLVMLSLLGATLAQAALILEVDEPFDCLPAPWNTAKVIHCTPSWDDDGIVHMFCHFKLEK